MLINSTAYTLTAEQLAASEASIARRKAAEQARRQALLDGRTPEQVAADEAAKEARSTKTAPERLAKLATHTDGKVRLAVARNKKTTAETLALLATDADPTLRAAVAKHANVTADTLDGLVGDAHMRVLTAIAGDMKAPAEVLHRIVAERPEAVTACRYIAQYQRVPSATFELLAAHDDEDVRFTVSTNPHAPASALRILALDPRTQHWSYLARHPNLPADAITHLAGHSDIKVRRMLGKRKDLTPDQETIFQLAGGTDFPRD
jgi:hypothetical protein